MQIGFIGLGKMGALMAERLIKAGHEVVGYNLSPEPTKALEANGLIGAYSVEELISKLTGPKKIIWLMVPHGQPVKDLLFGQPSCAEAPAGKPGLVNLLKAGDVIIDGGNSFYKDTLDNAKKLAEKGIEFVDAGTSGGLEGAKTGACIMIGAKQTVFNELEPIFKDLALPNGYKRVGETGAGHYVKMVHNGIEYALLQAYGEGFEMIERAPFELDLAEVANIWNHGSVIRSWLLELAENAFKADPHLAQIGDEIGGGSTGEWTTQTAVELNVPIPAMYLALAMRYRSRGESFSGKVVAALRNGFGGHEVSPASTSQEASSWRGGLNKLKKD